jgi:hypothetical protein
MNRYKLPPIIIFMFVVTLFAGMVTTAAQATSTATPTPPPSKTPPPIPTMTSTPTPQGTELILQIAAGADDVNESSGNFVADQTDLWVGNAGASSSQYVGLRFTDVAIPPGSEIHSAHLEVYYTSEQWIYLAYDFAAESDDNSEPFTSDNPPSKRKLTSAIVPHESNVPWLANTWYPLDEIADVVQEVISRPGWQTGNSLSLIAQGNASGGDFGRKFFSAFEIDPRIAARLIIDFSSTATDAAIDDACSDIALPARLTVGQGGQIDSSAPFTSLDVREMPDITAAVIGELESGVSFTVIDGPVCADGSRWFQVRLGNEKIEGWLAEAQPNPYFVEPLP